MTTKQLYDFFLKHPFVSTDNRKVVAGCLYFALKGDRFDGNQFAAPALENGAAYAVVDDHAVDKNDHYLLVGNVLEALQQLAAFHRQQLGCPVLAVTGTNGKTTTKELIAAVLGARYRVEYTRGNLNNHIGVPLTLLSMTADTGIGIVEMGANHPGEIAFLCSLAKPDYGLVTNMGKAHIEGFGSFEGVVRTKSELYRFLEESGGIVFVNGDNDLLLRSVGTKLQRVTYGTGETNFLHGEAIGALPFLKVKAAVGDLPVTIQTRLVGEYNLENVLAALSVGAYWNVDPDAMTAAIEAYTPSNNRSQFISTGRNEIVMDAYNANPGSMQASIANFLKLPHQQKACILGDMLELGEVSAAEHQQIVDMLSEEGGISVFLAGEHFYATRSPEHFLKFPSIEMLLNHLRERVLSGYLVLIKGSRGMQLEKASPLL
jgi:UDP-N-acetylmuramoyl-tripeptide--D-alanyl-D-alanine ligase